MNSFLPEMDFLNINQLQDIFEIKIVRGIIFFKKTNNTLLLID